jgi:acyl carrier protein
MQLDYDQILAAIREELAAVANASVEIGEDTDLVGDLDLGSLQVMNLLPEIEDRFDISIPVNILPAVRTVRDLALQIETIIRG